MDVFFEDNLNEFIEDNPDYLNYINEAKDKAEVYKVNYFLQENLQKKYVSKLLANKNVQEKIIGFVGSFIDKNQKVFSAVGPMYMFTFTQEDANYFYRLFSITPDEILSLFNDMVKETYYGEISKFMKGWIVHAPQKLLFASILIEALQKDYKDMIECCEWLFIFIEYPILFRKSWPLGVNEEVMIYTIEHLGSKYQIKKVKNIGEMCKYDADRCLDNMGEKLKSGVDNSYMDFMYDLRNRIKNKFVNIAREYKINYNEMNTAHETKSKYADGELSDQEGHANNIAKTIDKTNNLFATSPINTSIVKIMADGNNINADILKGYIEKIFNSKNNKLFKLTEDIIVSFFNKNPQSISVNTKEFINFGLQLYKSIGSSKDSTYIEINDIINYWMYNIVNIKSQYQNHGTIVNYTRGVYNYIIFMINIYNK